MTEQLAYRVGLHNCDREPIHILGQVQSHGVLVAFDMARRVTHRSANAQALLGALAPRIGQTLEETCFAADAEMLEVLHECLAGDAVEVQPIAIEVQLAGAVFELIAHRLDNRLLVELERLETPSELRADDAFRGHRALARIKRQRSVHELLAAAADEVRGLTGFDRVMVYRFRHDDSGEVVAEARADDLEPLVGRRYPASDIPAQARLLYTLNTLRIIVDVGSTAVPLEQASGETAPLDLSHSVLRSVSPVHIEYLGNMGVAASMSISIIVHGRLWGMLACHHRAPRHVPYRVRSACDVLAHILAANVQSALARASAERLEAAASVRARAIEHALHADEGVFALLSETQALCETFDCQSMVLAAHGRVAATSLAPEVARDLVQWLAVQPVGPTGMLVRDTQDGMPAVLREGLASWCGLLALQFSQATLGWLVLLRKEQVETIAWGGRPEKDYTHGPLGPRLTPRGSFEVWKQTVRGRSVPWDPVDLEIAQGLLADLARASTARGAELDRAREHLLDMLGASVDGAAAGREGVATGSLPAGGRMQRFVSQVVDAAMVQRASGLALATEPVELCGMLHAVLDAEAAEHPGLRFIRETPKRLTVQADAARMRQLLACLVGNARRHGAPDEVVIVQLQAHDGRVVLDVSNVGTEIPPQAALAMFDPFRVAPGGVRHNADGLGLGLYIARHIARAHGGDLQYTYAEPYVVFTLNLPAG
jgi:chemotaxis family two-component system sensor kinase Cph1